MKRFLFLIVAVLVPVVVFAQRLPRTVLPVHYDLTLFPHLAEETFEGKETIEVSVQEPTREIELNALDIDFRNVMVETESKEKERADVKLDPGKEFAILTVAQPIPPGPATIRIEYTGKLNRELRGFYIGDPPQHGSSGRKYAASQGEATDIRRAFPAFDEPAMKATYSTTIIVDTGDTAISNYNVASDTPGPGPGQHTIRFATTPRLSSYLVAMLAGDFHCLKDQADGVPLGICALGNQSSLGQFALDMTKGILGYYDGYYGIKYPFAKLDQIAIPDFSAGAMENPGAIVYRESALLADPKTASLTRRKAIASVIAHEMAHMWFGDLVTMRWWNDIWLNEGFATWMSSKPLKKLRPEWRFDLEEIGQSAEAMNTDVLANTRPIRANAETSREIDALFDSIAYQKTASLLRMIESYMGEENFRSGVNAYLASHAFDNAEAYDFFEALALASHTSADEVMNSYVNQAGVPLISVKTNCDGNDTVLQLQQRRFLESANTGKANDQRWIIPICVNQSANLKCQLLREMKQTYRLTGCNTARFLNQKGSGFFITEYEPDVESELVHSVATLPEAERMVFARDEWYLTMAHERSVGNFLQLTKALQSERASQYLESTFSHLQYIADYMTTPADIQTYQAWTRSLLQPVSREPGTKTVQDESEEQRLVRGQVLKALAVTGRDPETIKLVRSLAENYLRDRHSIDPNIATVILEAAAAVGDSTLYDQVIAAYRAGGTPEEVRRFVYVLAEFRDPALAERTMAYALSDEVRTQDTARLMAAVLKNPVGSRAAWNFIKQHWNEITRKISDAQQLRLVGATEYLCDEALRDDAKQFFAQHAVRGSDRDLAQAQEKSSICVDAKSFQQKNLADWLKSH